MGLQSSVPAGGDWRDGSGGTGPGRAARFAPFLMLASGVSMYVGASLAVSLFACFVMLLATLLGLAFARHPRMREAVN